MNDTHRRFSRTMGQAFPTGNAAYGNAIERYKSKEIGRAYLLCVVIGVSLAAVLFFGL